MGAHAEGDSTVAEGNFSHAEGSQTHSVGIQSHAEGFQTHSFGLNSHAEGEGSTAFGQASHAEGSGTLAEGDNSHAEGFFARAQGLQSHAEGNSTLAGDENSHAEGFSTRATGFSSHAEGSSTEARGADSHAEGNSTIADASFSHAEGENTVANGFQSHAEGFSTEAFGPSSHAEGSQTHSVGEASHAEGSGTTAFGTASHAEGNSTHAEGNNSHAEGSGTRAIGAFSHAEGFSTIAEGSNSHAEGDASHAVVQSSHAEGFSTRASGFGSHAEGNLTRAAGFSSHAEGDGTTAFGGSSHVGGEDSMAVYDEDFVHGKYIDSNCPDTIGSKAIFGRGTLAANARISDSVVWNGTIGGIRANQSGLYVANPVNVTPRIGFSVTDVDVNGTSISVVHGRPGMAVRGYQFIANSLASPGFSAGNVADMAEMFEFEDPSQNEYGRMVTFVGNTGATGNDFIRWATSSDLYVLGSVSSTVAFLANNPGEWPGKYVKDKHDRCVYDYSMCHGFMKMITDRMETIKAGATSAKGKEIRTFCQQLMGGIQPELLKDSEYDSFKTSLSDSIDATSVFTEDEKAAILDETGLTGQYCPKICEDYDPSLHYKLRTQRDEWGSIGLMGQLVVEDDGTCHIGGFAKVGVDGKVTKSTDPGDLRWPVIRRHSATTVRILFR